MIELINARMVARITVALAIILLVLWWHRNAVMTGRDEIKAQDAVILTEIQAQNQAEVARIKQLNKDISYVYQEKLVRSHQDNAQLRADLANVRVCLTEPSHRRSLPVSPKPPNGASDTTSGNGLQPTIAGDLVTLIGECQRNTEKLMALQRWVTSSTEH